MEQMQSPKKGSFENFKKTITMFFVDKKHEKMIDDEISRKVDMLHKKLYDIGTKDGLIKYITDDNYSLDNLTSLLSISTEKFKRIISMIRIWNADYYSTEWDIERIRREAIKNEEFMSQICELLLHGCLLDKFKNTIPQFYLDYFLINKQTLNRLKNKDLLKTLVKKGSDGKYNNDIGDKIENLIENYLKELSKKYGFTYEREKNISWLTRNIDFIIPNISDPHVLLEVSYQITTGSAQTTKQRDEVKTSQDIRAHNIQNSSNIAFVNFLEGAGWMARQLDMEKIFNCSDYVINIQTLNQLEIIIIKHTPDKYFKKPKPLMID